VINVLNGLLNLSSLELTPHRPDFLSAVQLPVRYDPAATCEAWEGFLSATLPEDAVHLGYEIAAWAMSPGNTGQTAVLLLGSGANGKSVFLSALEAYLGRENVCSVSLQKLEGDRFSASRLMGKLANVCADIPSSRLVGTSVFKALTGGDLIWAEKKFKDAFDYRPFAKLIFSANQVPYTDDSTYGFLRRWLVVPFNRTFEIGSAGHIPRAELDAMLAQPQELSGVLNMAVAYWPLIQADGLSSPESCQQALEDFRSIADPIRAWLEREVEQDPKGCIAKRDLWERYADDCKTERRPPISQKAFAMAIRKAMPGLRETQRTIRDKRQEVYVGVRYRRAETLQS
jgi:putative DNA primase/helicase